MSRSGRRRRWIRILRNSLFALAGLLVVAIGGIAILIHTTWGRATLRDEIVDKLNESVVGGVAIGSLEGSVFGTVNLHDVVIRDRAGRAAIVIDRVRLEIGLASLLRQRIHLEHAVAEGVKVEVERRDGRFNLADMTDASSASGSWGIEVVDLAIRDARASLDLDGNVAHFDDLTATGAVALPARGPAVARVDLAGSWRERGIPVHVAAELRAMAAVIAIPTAEIRIADARLVARALELSKSRAVGGQVTLSVPQDEIGRLTSDAKTNPAVALELTMRSAVDSRTAVTIEGTIAGSAVHGAISVSALSLPMHIEGTLSATRLDAERFVPGLGATVFNAEVALKVSVDPSRDGLALVDGTLALTGRGQIAGADLDDLTAHIVLASGTASVDATVRAQGGLQARLEVRGRQRDDGAIEVLQAHVLAKATEFERLVHGSFDLGGAAEIDLDASGVVRDGIPDLEVKGYIVGTRVHADEIAIGRARLDVDLRGTPSRPTGSVDATVGGAKLDGKPLPWFAVSAHSRTDGAFAIAVRSHDLSAAPAPAPWTIVADAVARFDRRSASIALGHFAGRARGTNFAGHGGRIDLYETEVAVRRIRAKVAGGVLEVDGHYRIGGPRAGDLAGHVIGRALDLAALDRLLTITGGLRGRAEVDATLRRAGNRLDGAIAGSVTSLVTRPGAASVDVTLAANLSPSGLSGKMTARSDPIGAMTASIDVTPPRDLTDPNAWSRLDRSAVRRIEIGIHDVQVGELARAVGDLPIARGQIDGSLVLAPATASGSIRGRDLVVTSIPAPIDLEVDLGAASAERVRASIRAVMREIASGNIAASVRIPAHPFDPSAWAGFDRTWLRDVRIAIDDVTLDERLANRLGILGGWRGRATMTLAVAEHLDRATATIVARDVIGGPLLRPLDATLALALDRAGLVANAEVAIAGAPLATASVNISIDPGRVLRTGTTALRTAPITGDLHLAPADLASLLAPIRERVARGVRGTVRGDVTLSGTLDDPVGSAAIVVSDPGTTRRVLLRDTHVDARYARGVVTAAAVGVQAGGGTFAIDVRAPLAHLESTVTTVAATSLDLAPLGRLVGPQLIGMSGLVDVDVRVHGLDPVTALAEGRIRVRSGTLPLTDELGALHDAVIDIELRGQRVRASLDGAIEAGKIAMTGNGTLEGLIPTTGVLDATVTSLSLITAAAPRVSGSIHAEISRRDDRWKIDAEVADGQVFIPDVPGRVLHPAGLPNNMVMVDGAIPPVTASQPPIVSSSGPPIDLAVRIRPVGVTSEQFRGQVSGTLDAGIGGARVVVTGRIDVVRGDVMLFERRYRIDRAAIHFDGGTDPILDIRLVHEFPQVRLRVAITGRLSNPQLALSSDRGAYTEAELLGFVLGGEPGNGSAGTIDDAANSVATSAVTQVLGKYVGQLVPVRIDILRYEAATSTHSGALTIGRRLSDRLFVSWRSRVDARDDENTGEGSLEYWLSGQLLLDGVVGNRGVHGLDLLWTHRW